jgi:hypothetical protein
MAKKKHKMNKTDRARIFLAGMDDSDDMTDKMVDKIMAKLLPQKSGLAQAYQGQNIPRPLTSDKTQYWDQPEPYTGLIGGREQRMPGKTGTMPWMGDKRIRPEATGRLEVMFTEPEIDYFSSAKDEFEGMVPWGEGWIPEDRFMAPSANVWRQRADRLGGYIPDEVSQAEMMGQLDDLQKQGQWGSFEPPSPYLDALDASDNWQSQEFLRRQAEARAATAPGQLGEMFGELSGRYDQERVQRLPGYLQTQRQMDAQRQKQEQLYGGIDRVGGTRNPLITDIDPNQLKEQNLATQRQQREARDDTLKTEFNRIAMEYQNLGAQIGRTTDAKERNELISQRNKLIGRGQSMVQQLQIPVGRPGNRKGEFPFVEPVTTGDLIKEDLEGATKDLDALQSTMGKGMGALGLKRGQVFRGTSYASTGAINGVMKALAGIFILFVFIGVFYMVFGPIYDSLIFNFTNIVSADGDPTLGGKDIPTLFDNIAKVILIWVPLLVFAGALYKLTALVFEREVGTRTTEETEWDMLGAIEDSTDLDAGSDPGVFEAYGGGY